MHAETLPLVGRFAESPAARLVVAASILMGVGASRVGGEVMSISSSDNLLRTIDPADGSTLWSTPITLEGRTVNKGNGLAVHTQTCELWGLLSIAGQQGRELVTIDPQSGVATSVGDTGDKFSALAFDGLGTLYGVTGDGAGVPETMYTLSTDDATPTFFMFLGNGDDGETISFNPDNGLMYHASGISENLDQYFECIDLDTHDITDIGLSGDEYWEAHALMYDGGGNFLLTSRAVDPFEPFLYRVTGDGVVTLVGGPMDHIAKGMATPCTEPCPADFTGDGAVGPPDLAFLLASWGPYDPCVPIHAADLNHDCTVNAADLSVVLGSWGPCE